MPFAKLLTHIAFALSTFALSLGLTLFMIRFVRLMDVPNERSSHRTPIPKSGGVGIVVSFAIACLVIYFGAQTARIPAAIFWAFFACTLALALVSLIDDVTQKSFVAKIGAQVVSVGILLAAGIVLTKIWIPFVGEVSLGVWSYLLTFLWMVGLTNAFNFMDGLDGLAGGVGVIAAIFMCIIAWSQGSYFVYITSYALIASVAGFLVFNFPPAKIFMGDVGSAFLGFTFGALAVIGASFDFGRLSFYVVPLLLFNFIFDTFFTFVRRLLRGERIHLAHRSHLYQLLNRMGYSHRKVALFHYAVALVQGVGAILLVHVPPSSRLLIFAPFVIFQVVYARRVLERARAMSLT